MTRNRITKFTCGLLWLSLSVMMFGDVTEAQDLSWVKDAMERSKSAARDSVPLWQYDPRIAAGNGDASLRAVTSTTGDRLWAVGDRGLILSSRNGGRSWTQQRSATTLNLHAVAFINDRQGCIVGGTVQASSRTSVGVVLVTEDSGETWRVANGIAPARMTGLMRGKSGELVAWGDWSPLHNSAALSSRDGGQSWQSVASPLGHLQACGRDTAGLQLGVDRAGRIAQLPSPMDRQLHQLSAPELPINHLAHSGSLWIAAGTGGTLATSRDGRQWDDGTLPLSAQARAVLDFRCIGTFENHVWAAGQPGSLLMHSDDFGAHWQSQPMGQTWPINAVHFFDQHRGWAVTDAGSILATRDGGKSWFPQRIPIQRLGLQAFSSLPEGISWPVLADAAWQARQASSLLVMHRENIEDAVDFLPDGPATLAAIGTQASLVDVHQSSAYALGDRRVLHGSALAAHYQGSPHRSLTNDPHAGNATDMMLALALQLRVGRPSVVLVDDLPSGESSFLIEAVVRAVEAAGGMQPAQSDWLASELYLPPWRVSKIFASARRNQGDFTIAFDQMLGDTGLTVLDALVPIAGFDSRGRSSATLRCLQTSATAVAARSSVFHITDRQDESTRPVDLTKIGNIQLVMGRVHREKAWATLSLQTELNDEPIETWLRKLESIIEKTPRHEIGPALVEHAKLNFAEGRWDRWQLLLERCWTDWPLSDAARWSAQQSLRYAASDERLAWESSLHKALDQKFRQLDVQTASATSPMRGLSQSLELTPFGSDTPSGNDPHSSSDPRASSNHTDASARDARPSSLVKTELGIAVTAASAAASGNAASDNASVITAAAQGPAVDSPFTNDQRARQLAMLRQAVRQFGEFADSDPSLVRRPDFQLANYARRRMLAEVGQEPAPDASVLQLMASGPPLPGWLQSAKQELVLASAGTPHANWTAHACRAAAPPRLDGDGNEPFWQNSPPIGLTSPFDFESPLAVTTAQFAYDDEYLYVMLKCPEANVGRGTPLPREARRYDMQLDGTDYVQLMFDTDRDYTSACDLAVNVAGHTFDRCCESKEWNPRWFVAIDRADHNWTAELAIQLSDLTTLTEVAGRVWAISAFRYIPQRDVQSWSQLRSYNPRQQGNGLLLFDP